MGMKVGIVYKHKAPEPLEVLEGFIPWLKKKGIEPLMTGDQAGGFEGVTACTPEVMAGEAEFVIVLGGDGTMLHAANLLAGHNVNALIVGGIGMRPLMGFKQVGIEVYHDATRPEIGPVVEDLIAGRLPLITEYQVCGGGGG